MMALQGCPRNQIDGRRQIEGIVSLPQDGQHGGPGAEVAPALEEGAQVGWKTVSRRQ